MEIINIEPSITDRHQEFLETGKTIYCKSGKLCGLRINHNGVDFSHTWENQRGK